MDTGVAFASFTFLSMGWSRECTHTHTQKQSLGGWKRQRNMKQGDQGPCRSLEEGMCPNQ